MTGIGPQLEKLAKRICRELMDDKKGEKYSFDERLDAFKALSTYHVGVSRIRKGEDETDPTMTTLADIRNRALREDANGDEPN